jgi:hypothetical protein
VVNIPGASSPQIDALRRLQRQTVHVCVVCTSKVRKLTDRCPAPPAASDCARLCSLYQ